MSIGYIPSNYDDEGDPISKAKVTHQSYIFQKRNIVWTTSSEVIENDHFDGTPFGDATLTHYDDQDNIVSGVEVSGAVMSHLDFEPSYSYDLIAGVLETVCVVNQLPYTKNARMWCVGVPTLPAAFGGSVEMITNEIIPNDEGVLIADGKGSKQFNPDPVYHTNLIRTTIKHAMGQQIRMKIAFEHYWDRSEA